jgi:glycosyltransferase involved in cell wall biosynthesis
MNPVPKKKMLNIGVVSHDTFWPLRGGGGIRVYWVTKSMLRRKYSVSVVAPFLHRDGLKEEFDPICVLSAGKFSRFVKFKEIVYCLLMARIFFKLLFRRFDVIYAHNAVAALPSILVSRLKRTPVVFDFDDLLTGYSRNPVVYRWGPVMERWVARRADLTIVNSKVVQKWCAEHGIHNTLIVRHGVDLARFYDRKSQRKYITFTGGMEVNDGVLLIPNAAKDVLKIYPEENFLFVGAGKEVDNLVRLVEELGLSKSFIFRGWTEHGKIPGILAESKMGIIPMLKVSATELSTRLSFYEYMASELPFIASDLDCSVEQVEESQAGIVFKNGDAGSLAQAILKLLQDGKLRRTRGHNGRRYVEEHADWRKNADKICDACERIFQDWSKD